MADDENFKKTKDKSFLAALKEIAKKEKAIFYRLELDVSKTSGVKPPTAGYIRAFEEMQPENTLILDLKMTEDELLTQMKQKGRYNIRLAEKKGIKINPQASISAFYHLYEETGKRHGISYRGKRYFESLLENLSKNSYINIYSASVKIEGKEIVLASAIVVYSQKTAIYLFGASSDKYKNVMAPYLMQWQIIKDAKSKGYTEYDFFGIAPDDDPKHPWQGVTKFKRQFGGKDKAILGSYDYIFNPPIYKLFKIAEKIRRC